MLEDRLSDADSALPQVTWYPVVALAVLSGLSLLVTAALWILYRRRRADLHAAGAEAIGELLARPAN